jgi:hypothetical protein
MPHWGVIGRSNCPVSVLTSNCGMPGPQSAVIFYRIFYIGSVTYSSAPPFVFDTPTSSRLARIAASELDGWASSGGGEAVSQTFKLSGATTAESRMTSDGFVSGSTPLLLAAVAFLRFTKRTYETIARRRIEMATPPYATDSIV